jgi:hypothetical protein
MVLSLAIIVIYGVFFITFLGRTGPRDADQFLVFHSLQYWNATMFGLAKQWTPLMCAGLSMAGEPQIPFMSLSMCLSYLLGPYWGLKIAIPIYFSLGWVGAFLYAGLWLKSREQRMLAASLFIGNGFFVCRVAYGHFDLVPFLVLPLILWILHSSTRGASFSVKASPLIGATWGLVTLLTGGLIAMVIDGSPVAIIHLLFWVGVYALALSFWARSWRPTALMVCAILVAAVLDAGYLWPMVQAQAEFPRLTVDTFTSILSFLWFALLPMRGKVLPANGNGHELSVFIGPVMAYFIWKYRSWIISSMPREMKGPLSVVTAVSLVLGMGSLRLVHIPAWLSPFDLLRSLPGFRSIGVTGRYWGFAVLPLSLCAAGALSRYAGECREGWRTTLCLMAILALPRLATRLFLTKAFSLEALSILTTSPWARSTTRENSFLPFVRSVIAMTWMTFNARTLRPAQVWSLRPMPLPLPLARWLPCGVRAFRAGVPSSCNWTVHSPTQGLTAKWPICRRRASFSNKPITRYGMRQGVPPLRTPRDTSRWNVRTPHCGGGSSSFVSSTPSARALPAYRRVPGPDGWCSLSHSLCSP